MTTTIDFIFDSIALTIDIASTIAIGGAATTQKSQIRRINVVAMMWIGCGYEIGIVFEIGCHFVDEEKDTCSVRERQMLTENYSLLRRGYI